MSQERKIVLELSNINKRYGGVCALSDAKFSCAAGEVHALLGENGAGKSTLVKILCGVVKKDSGKIVFEGNELNLQNPIEAEKHGIVAVFQELSLVPDLTVAENIFLGLEPKNKFKLIDKKTMTMEAEKLLQRLEIDVDPRAMVADIPLVKKQLVEIAKAFSKNPKVIVFDEATSALGKSEVELLFKLIRQFVEAGNCAVFISHRMDEIAQIADMATIYRDSKYVDTFKVGTVSDAEIINMVAGREMTETFPPRTDNPYTECALELENVSAGDNLIDVSVKVTKGEILGVAGLQGQGQSELLKCLYGDLHIDQGTVKVFGKPVNLRSPRAALKEGIVLVPEDRKTEGLFLTSSIRDNLSVMSLNKIREAFYISKKKEEEVLNNAVKVLQIKTPNLTQAVNNLSGGNQQKVVIGKTVITNAEILLFGDPTRGIDVGTKAEIYILMRKLAAEGKTIIFYSTETNELIGLCDKILVFREGKVVAELQKEDISETRIIQHSMGLSEVTV